MNSIKAIRKRRHVSAESLARELGVTRQTVVNWEAGTTEPPASAIKKMADFFGVTTDELLKEG